MTANPFAALLRDVPRFDAFDGDFKQSEKGSWVTHASVLAALAAAVPADLAEAEKDAAWLRNIHGGHPDANRFDDVARNITALLAHIAAQEARVRESAMQELASLGQAQEAYEAQKAVETALAAMTNERDELAARLSRAYGERTAASVAAARFALMNGYQAGIGKDGNEHWDDEWRVVLYVDTPAGQVSWHIAPSDQHLLVGLPQYSGEWDGTFRSRDGSYCAWDHTAAETALAAERAKVAKLVEALTLAANRLSRRAVEYVPGGRLFIETWEWADEARAAITEAGQ